MEQITRVKMRDGIKGTKIAEVECEGTPTTKHLLQDTNCTYSVHVTNMQKFQHEKPFIIA